MTFRHNFFSYCFYLFLSLLCVSSLFASREILLEVVNKDIEEETSLKVRVFNDRLGGNEGKILFQFQPVADQPKPVYFCIASNRLSSIELSLFFDESRHKTALFYVQDIKFIPLKKISVSLFSSRIDVDVIYNLPPVWNAENSSAK